MSQSKIQPLLPMPLSEKGLFGYDYSLHASLSQVISSCLRCKRLVGDFLKALSDLRGILSLPGSDEVLGIASISLRKLRRMTTWGFLQVGAMFSLQSGDGEVV